MIKKINIVIDLTAKVSVLKLKLNWKYLEMGNYNSLGKKVHATSKQRYQESNETKNMLYVQYKFLKHFSKYFVDLLGLMPFFVQNQA